MSEIITHEGDTIITLVPPRWLDPVFIPGGGGGGVSPKFGVFALCCRTVTETQGSTCKCEKVDVMPYYTDTNSVDTFSAAGKVVLGVEKVTFFGTFWVKQFSQIFDSFIDAWNYYIANGPAAVWKERGEEECCPEIWYLTVNSMGDCCCEHEGHHGKHLDLPDGQYRVTYYAGAAKTNSYSSWNYKLDGPCQGCPGPGCWWFKLHDGNFLPGAIASGSAEAAEAAAVGSSTSVTVSGGTGLSIWYKDNGCDDNEGSVTWAIERL